MTRWKYVLFDMDGTLIDSAPMVTKRFAETFQYFGIAVPDEKELHSLVGPSAAMTMEKYLGVERAAAGVAHYRKVAAEQGISQLLPFPGVAEAISRLSTSGLRLAVATSKPEVEAVRILNNVDLAHFFDVVSGASDTEGVHRKADVISRALQRLEVSSLEECVMVGDRIFDVEGAEECGLETVFVSWGGADVDEASRALVIIDQPHELVDLVVTSGN